ncbi:HpcH/HpaI aldolase/citrate lyase family protein [Paralimibaculum aggregatum]|uniref:HpcH/HpaI aldolase/citrate lyase family protein n=1 Tax=Paralimibaculum aggregatum TaxID=3036245 RepID=A0ABQ6LS53_9RHOB|nr:aldolase/citrate lyase family protein [Limibaculum sp. NKW23]GMG84475.1 HpcH/HpaI aldolase/citrate lyase family protein [Limibaculum sp. NKW23]
MATARNKLEELCGRCPVHVAWLGLPHAVAARLAAEAGFEAAVVDREHGAIGIETAAAMVFALGAEAVGAFVRVPDHGRHAVAQALDAGADGLIVPQVESAAEAAAVVRTALYPPAGTRGVALPVIGATGYGTDRNYQAEWNARVILAMQIESRAGLAAAAEIAAVEGVDMLFFGPFDYAADAGLDPHADGAALQAVFAEIVAAAKAAGKLAGVFPWPGQTTSTLAASGADMIAAASDIATLRQGFAAALGESRGA